MNTGSTAVTISLVISGMLMIGWIVYGIREFRRTGTGTWLWMSCLLGFSFLVLLTQLLR